MPGTSFGDDPARYDRARLPCPDPVTDAIITASPGRDVLDAGCGTGIASRQFQRAGCEVTGVDPDPRMAAFAVARAVKDGLPLSVEISRFEDWEPGGRTFDLVIAGTSWHWIDPAAGAAKAAAVLRPGGRLAAFWNVFTLPPAADHAFSEICREVLGSPFSFSASISTGVFSAASSKAARGMRLAGVFCLPQEWRFGWEHTVTRESWLDLLMTLGSFARLKPAARAELLARAAGAAPDTLTLQCTTVVATAALPGGRDAAVPWRRMIGEYEPDPMADYRLTGDGSSLVSSMRESFGR
jgi:SAM-dependent methyltransferase